MKDRVLQWIEQGCDYNTGILLLADSGKHRQLIKIIVNRPHRYASKLLYELCKEAGIPYLDLGHADLYIHTKDSGQADLVPDNHSFGQADVKNTTASLSTPTPDDLPLTDIPSHLKTMSDQDFNRLPVEMQKVIREHSKLFLLRSRLHEQMANLSEDNLPDTVKKRKTLSDSIAELSPRIDQLFQAKEDFYLKSLKPDLAVLFPPLLPDAEQSLKNTPLPDSTKELKKLKKNLQSSNVKDQNMLDFQEETKASKPSPMPTGPKRQKLEQRISKRLIQIEAIDYKLLTIKE